MEAAEEGLAKMHLDCEPTGSSSSTPAPVETELAQRHINSLLQVPRLLHGQLPLDAMLLLKSMESLKPPESLASGPFEPAHTPRTSCFDTVETQASWSAHRICERCAACNRVLQGECRLRCRFSARFGLFQCKEVQRGDV